VTTPGQSPSSGTCWPLRCGCWAPSTLDRWTDHVEPVVHSSEQHAPVRAPHPADQSVRGIADLPAHMRRGSRAVVAIAPQVGPPSPRRRHYQSRAPMG
jgi:hypothetical protein